MTFLVDVIQVIAEVSFQKHVVKDNQSPLQMAIEDINGDFSFSTFRMRIISGKPIDNPLKNRVLIDGEYSLDNIFDLAVDIIKQFILSYRAACELEALKYDNPIIIRSYNKDWIPEISRERLSPWLDTQVFDQNGNSLFKHHSHDYRGTGVGLGTDLKDDTLQMLQTYCKAIITLDNRHYFQIARRHYINHEYEAYCIMLVSVMEKQIFELCREKLRNIGNSESQIKDKMYNSKKTRKDGSKELIGIGKALKIICDGKKLDDVPEYKQVSTKVYAIRDQIIHGDIIRVSRAQAELMSKPYSDYMQYLRNVVGHK